MPEHMTKIMILAAIESEWRALQEIIYGLTPVQMTQPGVESDWTVKDILAHVSAWEKLMRQWTKESLQGQVPQRPAPGMDWDDLDALNDQIYQSNKDKPLKEVLDEFHRSYQVSLETVRGLSEADLLDPGRFAWRKGDPLWPMVAANTWEHYQEHRQTIEKWLSNTGAG